MIKISLSLSDHVFSYQSSVPSSGIDLANGTISSVFGADTSAAFLSSSLDWISQGLVVQIRDNYSDPTFVNQTGEVRGINVIVLFRNKCNFPFVNSMLQHSLFIQVYH